MYTDADWRWFQAHVMIPYTQDAKGIIAFMNGAPAAGCVLQNWLQGSVEMHHVLLRPTILRHGWLETLYAASGGTRSAYGLVSADRPKSLKFHAHVGFTEVGRIKDGDRPGIDMIILCVKPQEFKFKWGC